MTYGIGMGLGCTSSVCICMMYNMYTQAILCGMYLMFRVFLIHSCLIVLSKYVLYSLVSVLCFGVVWCGMVWYDMM